MSAAGRILVLGGAGFIGSHLVDELVSAGREVRVLDCLHERAHSSEPGYLNPGAEYLWRDVRDGEAVRRALRGVDAVSHQASMVGLGVDMGDIAEYVAHNDLGTAVLLREMHAHGFDGRVVLAGSMVVYGEGRFRCATHGIVAPPARSVADLSQGRFDPPCPACGRALDALPVPESAPPDPRSVYAATKLHQEHLCAAYARETGASVIALRYHNVYGPRMPRDTPYAGVASIFRSALAAGRAPRVFEDGRQLRDFVHVADVAHANVLALDAEADVNGPLNIASGEPRSVGEMASTMARAMNGPQPRVSGEFRFGDVRHIFASTERARQTLGFRPRVSFAAGVAGFAAAPLREPAAA